ncbi:MAG: DNRLRE domain-containing protein [Ruminiclostridium sp.]
MSIITLIQTFDDLYIDSSQSDTNFNSSPTLLVGKYTEDTLERSLIKFDLSFIPVGSSIISSNLNLYLDYDASETGQVTTIIPYAISDSWGVSTVTWNNQPAINDLITGTAIDVSAPGYYSWTVTELVNQWVNGGLANNGLELKTEEIDLDENKRFVSSNENEPEKQAFKPTLVIQYNPSSPKSVNAIIAGHGVDTEHEMVTTSDVYQSTVIKNTSQKTLVSFFVNNLTSNIADVGVEVSANGVNFLRESFTSISQGIQIFIPSYSAAYTRIYYRSNTSGKATTLNIDYVAQA